MAADSTEERRSEPTGALSAVATGRDDLRVREFDRGMIADALAMRQLRAALDMFASQHGQAKEPDASIPLERSQVIALLTQLQSGLSDSLMRPANLPPVHEDDPEIIFEHPTMSLLSHFIDALSDLDIDKTDTIFKTRGNSLGRSLPHYEVRRRDALLELVDVTRLGDKLPTMAAAERKVARMIRKNSKHPEDALTAEQLKELRKTRRKSQRHRAGN